jgi:hypothetical protein
MNIIFGDAINQLPKDYITLELDTITIQPIRYKVVTWCVIDNVPAEEISNLDLNKKLHNDLLIEYRNQNWNACIDNINSLMGRWGGEADTFYQTLSKRIEHYQTYPPEPGWDGSVQRSLIDT